MKRGLFLLLWLVLIADAHDLPAEKKAEFFGAYGSSLVKKTAIESLKRMGDNQTVRICLFLMFMCPCIDADEFQTVTELFQTYVDALDEATGGTAFATPSSKVSFEKQFRKICSADGLHLKGRGRPKKNTPAA